MPYKIRIENDNCYVRLINGEPCTADIHHADSFDTQAEAQEFCDTYNDPDNKYYSDDVCYSVEVVSQENK